MRRGAPSWFGRTGVGPLVLGHRGASREAPENTLAAFRLALEQGADGVELDVWRCRSGEVVVFHDSDCRRIAGAPLQITGARWSELRALDVGLHKGEKYRGERIPLLEQVFEALPSALVNVELKSPGLGRGDPRLAWAVARMVAERGVADRVMVSSFDPVLLGVFRLAAPRIPTGMLFGVDQQWRLVADIAAPALRPAAFHPESALVTPERASAWRQRGYALNVWTVDAPGEVDRLCGLGVNGLITNVPAEVARKVKGRVSG